MLSWSEQFATGHPEVDGQHRMLIAHVNRIHLMSHNQRLNHEDISCFRHFVDFLEDYIAMHFNMEEKCMVRHQCPAHELNCRAHHDFMAFYQRFRQRTRAETVNLKMIRELYEFCVLWIQDHILRIDRQLKPCLAGANKSGGAD